MKRHFSRLLFCLALPAAGCVMLALGASAATPVSDFDFARYASDNPDLMRAYGPDLNLEELYLHYLNYGASEGRTAYSLQTCQPFVLEDNAQQAYQTHQPSPAGRRGPSGPAPACRFLRSEIRSCRSITY